MTDDTDAAEQEPPAVSKRAYNTRKRRLEKARNEAEEFWRAVFASEIGRCEMWGLLQQTHAFEERFACGPNGFPQVEATWFHAGEQAFGLRLYQSWLKMAPEGVFAMHSECDPRFANPDRKRD